MDWFILAQRVYYYPRPPLCRSKMSFASHFSHSCVILVIPLSFHQSYVIPSFIRHSIIHTSFHTMIYFGTKGVLLPQTPFVPFQNVFCISFQSFLCHFSHSFVIPPVICHSIIYTPFHHSYVIPHHDLFWHKGCTITPDPLCAVPKCRLHLIPVIPVSFNSFWVEG